MENTIVRPKTRGELYDNLQQGIKCEVVASNESITTTLLITIGLMKKEVLNIKTYPSENEGWVVYEKAD